MTDEEKQAMTEAVETAAKIYYSNFQFFYEKCGNIEQAYRLTKDMHTSLFNQNKNDSMSIFWDK